MSAAPDVMAERPAPGPPRAYRFPEFERHRLTNGMQVVVATVRKLPVATARLVLDAGAMTEPHGTEGVAHLTARALLEGTASRDADALAIELERLGASVEVGASWDVATLTATVVSLRLPALLEIMAEMVRAPRFAERDVLRLRAEMLAELVNRRAEPRGLADDSFGRFVYERGSRYAAPEDGRRESVGALDPDDLATFHRARMVPAAATLLVAGDVEPEAIVALAERTLGDWTGEAPAPTTVLDAPAHDRPGVHLVRRAEAPQSELRIGHVGLPRRHPDYFAVTVMNAILGGLFNSRINMNLRETHAYTYGAFSTFEFRRAAGPFVVSTAVQSEVTAAAAREVMNEIGRMRAEPVASDELSLAVSYLDGVFPIRYETTAAIAQALTTLVAYDLPPDFYDTYRGHVRAVTLPDVLHAAERHLRPEAMQVVVVGDPAVVEEPLRDGGFGAVEVVDG
jgi:zinc protease